MGQAKKLIVKPINHRSASLLVKKVHYSGKVVNNSQLHLGVFWQGRLEGAMQFGPPMDRRNLIGLVKETKFNDFLELNRMAFTDALPRNSESRALAIAFRLIKKKYPQIEWIVSFSDATQSGDGAIYRASGFVLTQITKNKTIKQLLNGEVAAAHGTSKKDFRGSKVLSGYQLRYIKFMNEAARSRLSVPVLPFSAIDRLGARMYRGSKPSVGSVESDTPAIQAGEDGANPISTLQTKEADG